MATKNLKTQLEVDANVDGATSGIANVRKSLDTLGPAAAKAGKEASSGLSGMGDGAAGASEKVDRATKRIQQSIERQIAVMEAGGRTGADYYRILAGQRGANLDTLKPYIDQLDALAQKQRAAGSLLTAGAAQFNEYGLSAKQTTAALRQVPAQITDIVVSLQGGQAPLTVLLQQGGQLRDVFGGIAPAARALGSALLGLVNPYTVLAAIAAATAAAYNAGSKEADAYAKALILSGNAAGSTVGQLDQMARAIGVVAGTQGNAADALAQLAATGQVGAANLERFGLATVQFERAAGQAIGDTVKAFAELGKSPLDATVKLNESMRYLTTSTYEQIKALQGAGRESEAATVAQKAYADAIQNRSGDILERLGSIERAWLAIKDATKGAIDVALGIGRQDTLQTQLAKVNKQISDAESKPFNPSVFGGNAELRAQLPLLKARRDTIEESLRLADRAAQTQGASARNVEASIRADKFLDQYAPKALKLEQELAKAREAAAAKNLTAAETEKLLQQVREKFTDKGAARAVLAVDKSRLGLDVENIRNAGAAMVEIYTTSERILDSVRAAGLLSDREYYESKRAFIALDAKAKEDAAQKEVDRLRAEKLTGAAALDNQKKIADAQAKITKARIDAAAQTEVLDNQEQGRVRQLALGYQQARASAEAFLQTLRDQNDRAVAAVGMSDRGRDRSAGLNQIEDRYAQQRLQLESERRQGAYKGREDDYARDLALIQEYQEKATAAFNDGFDRRLAAQENWLNGANRALQNYIDSTTNAAAVTEQLFTRAFSSMEDALVKFATTGKLDFKSLANSIIADIIRIQVRAQLANSASMQGGWLNTLLGAFGIGSGKYSGSSTNPSAANYTNSLDAGFSLNALGNVFQSRGLSAYSSTVVDRPTVFPFARGVGLMGEAGPEAIMPLRRTSDGRLGIAATGGDTGGKSVALNYSPVINIDSRTDAEQVARLVAQANAQAKREMFEQLRAQGVFG